MALPTNKISKVKLPDTNEYDIIPSMLRDGTTNYKLSVPTLSADSTIALTSDISPVFRYGTQGTTTKIKISINSTTSWMLSFVVTLYQGYRATKIMVSGYNYGENHWYQPEARILGDSDNNDSIYVYFGYDSNWHLWVGFDGGNYTGVSVTDITNGYSQIDFSGLFTIEDVSSLSTIQDTILAVSYAATAGYATSAGNADTTDGLHVHSGRNNEANKIVRTNDNGYLLTGYINSDSGDENNSSAPARIWGTNGSDSYLRTYNKDYVQVGYASSSGSADALSSSTTAASGNVRYNNATGAMTIHSSATNEQIHFGSSACRISQEPSSTLTRYTGATVTLPVSSATKGIAILADEGGDFGLLYVGSDGAVIANSGDNGYIFKVYDKDQNSSDYTSGTGFCFGVKHSGHGVVVPQGNLEVAGNTSTAGVSSSNTITITKNGVTTTLGSENSSWFHIQTNNDVPVYFGESIAVNGNIDFYNHASMRFNTTEDCIEFVFA